MLNRNPAPLDTEFSFSADHPYELTPSRRVDSRAFTHPAAPETGVGRNRPPTCTDADPDHLRAIATAPLYLCCFNVVGAAGLEPTTSCL
jgi:hypothetical protein